MRLVVDKSQILFQFRVLYKSGRLMNAFDYLELHINGAQCW